MSNEPLFEVADPDDPGRTIMVRRTEVILPKEEYEATARVLVQFWDVERGDPARAIESLEEFSMLQLIVPERFLLLRAQPNAAEGRRLGDLMRRALATHGAPEMFSDEEHYGIRLGPWRPAPEVISGQRRSGE